ncbi:MAG: 3-deoxy-8-phosphooctulonate synthase [Phycisphaerales bacterium]
MINPCRVGDIEIGPGRPLVVIAGPCLLESEALGLEIGECVAGACAEAGLPYIFKASFDKANRTSAGSDRGPGLEAGLDAIARIGEKLGAPTTTDIHAPEQAEAAAARVDLLQIPAFLCRQTDLLVAAAHAASAHGRAVNVKKGQFLSPAEMAGPMGKLKGAGCANVMATERGTFFGYNRLVNDFAGLADMMDLGLPVCFDATHSTQLPGAGATSGGRPERAPLLARAAVAAGVHAVFLECHPDPKRGKSDAATMLTLDSVPALLADLARLREAMTAQPAR